MLPPRSTVPVRIPSRSLGALGIAALILICAGSAHAQVSWTTDLAEWTTWVDGKLTFQVDFEGLTPTEIVLPQIAGVETAPHVDLGGLNPPNQLLGMLDSITELYSVGAIAPLANSSLDPNPVAGGPATAHLDLFTDWGSTTVHMDFDNGLATPVYAWGAQFYGTAGNEGVALSPWVQDSGAGLLQLPALPVTLAGGSGFFGFALPAGQSLLKLAFVSQSSQAGGEGFQVDDVVGSYDLLSVPSVPEPRGLGLLFLGLVGLALHRRRPKRC